MAAKINNLKLMKTAHATLSVAGALVGCVSAQDKIAHLPSGISEDLWVAVSQGQFAVSSTWPALAKVEGNQPEKTPALMVQCTATLEPQKFSAAQSNAVSEQEIIGSSQYPPTFSSALEKTEGDTTAVSTKQNLIIMAGAYRRPGTYNADCQKIYHSVKHQIKSNEENILAIVSLESGANPACACEVVNAAIGATDSDPDGVAAIAEAAMVAAPESMRIIFQCVIASAPDSLPKIQALLATLDPNGGDIESSKSAKNSKSAKQATVAKEQIAAITEPTNPLNRFNYGPPLPPPVFIIPPVTEVNP